jgi:transcription termination factor Rho
MNLQELKVRSPAELLAFAEELEIENCNSMRKQDMMFAILKQLARGRRADFGTGVLEVLQDGFGFLRSPKKTTCPVPTTFTSPLRKCAASGCVPAISSKARSAPRKIPSATSRCSRSVRSIMKHRKRSVTASISITSRRFIPDRKIKLEISDPTKKTTLFSASSS